MYQQGRISYLGQFGILLGLIGVGLILAAMASAILVVSLLHVPVTEMEFEMLKPENASVIRLIQGVGAFVALGIPALLYGRILNQDPLQELGFSRIINAKQIGTMVLIVLVALAVSGSLAQLNEQIPISKHWQKIFRKAEDEYTQQVLVIANMRSFGEYLYTLVILAFVPAMVEEMFFRGCMQQLLVRWTKRAWIGILITSIIFSAFHLSYYGFLPRLFLGGMLGYLFYFSKNIWLNILAHFVNNALAVTQMYVLSKTGKLDADSMNETYPYYFGAIGLIAVIALFIYFKKESDKLQAAHAIPTTTDNQ